MPTNEVARSAKMADFLFKVGSHENEALRVVAFEGTEAISELFELRLELAVAGPEIAFDSVIGKGCSLTITGQHGIREINGMVRSFERTGESGQYTYYVAIIVPLQWQLTQRKRSRIFQEHNCPDMTVPGIIKKVLTDAGIPSDAFRFALQGKYVAREYVVQYCESEHDFVKRLMEDEGIFFFYEHKDGKHVMVFGDTVTAHVANPVGAEFPYRDPSGLISEDPFTEQIHKVRMREELQIGNVALRDFNFQKPQQDMQAASAAADQTSFIDYDYVGLYDEKGAGGHFSQVRLEQYQAGRLVHEMEGNVRGCTPGFRFTLKEHPNETLNDKEYTIVRVFHRGQETQATEEAASPEGAAYTAELLTMPGDIVFRPQRTTPRPVIHGTQTAFVVGPTGEEIYTDKYGRVKVQFHWDIEGVLDENSSCWIRVSQGWAGGQYGMMFLPRVGQEVVVDFLNGNPDHPLIVGRVFNNDLMPPYALPKEKTKSTIKTNTSKGKGSNEIRFEDASGKEQLLLHAQRQLDIHVRANRLDTTGGDYHVHTTGKKYEYCKDESHIEVKLDQLQKVGGSVFTEITSDYGLKVGSNMSQDVGGKLYIKSTGDMVLESTAGITLKCGGNLVKIDPSGVTILGTMVKINSGGAGASGQAVALTAPEEAGTAEKVEPGKDVTYTKAGQTIKALSGIDPVTPTREVEEEELLTSWVEIEMVDEDGQPWANEYYEVTRKDGKVIKGYLNSKGQARIRLLKPEAVDVSFPNLDQEAWEQVS